MDVGSISYTVDVETSGAITANNKLDKSLGQLDKGMGKTTKMADGVRKGIGSMGDSARSAAGGFAKLIAPLVSVAAAMGALRKLVEVQRQFDILNAGLITATGSAEKAAIAFQALQDFAAKTPYDLNQAVEGFTQLVNLGLNPSEKALISYGNTASAMGKSLEQMIGAVADASTGEFERLKEFGIKAKSEGDKVSLTFQGVTTTIGKNASEIENYLIALGENQFAGAMAQRMASLDGAISNLGDTWDNTFRLIAASGAGDMIEAAVRQATAALEEFNAMLASGELGANIDAILGKFSGFRSDVSETFSFLTGMIQDDTGYWNDLLTANVNNMIETFSNFPENVRAFIQIMVTEVLSGFDKVKAYSTAFKGSIDAIFSDQTFEGVGAALEAELKRIGDVRGEVIADILNERDAALDSYDAQREAAKKLREEYEKQKAAREAGGVDRLAGFGRGAAAGAGGGTAVSEEAVKAAKKAADEQKKGIEANAMAVSKLREQLYQAGLDAATLAQRQAELSLNQYATPEQIQQVRNLALELQNIEARKELGANPAEVSAGIRGNVTPLSGGPFDDQSARFEAEAAAENERYMAQQERLRAALEIQAITKQEAYALEQQMAQENADRLAQIEQAKNSAMLQSGATLFGELASAAQGFAGEQSALYKTMFAASKAFAIADAAVKIQQGIASAAALPFPANIPAMASVAAATAGIISTISSVAMAGRAQGGPVQSDQMYRINETGAPEVFNAANGRQYMLPNQRGDVVSNADATSGGGGAQVIVNVNNNSSGATATATSRTDSDRRQIIDIVVADMMSGGRTAGATNRITGTRRAGA